MATRYGTWTFTSELDCDWMTVDVDITFILSNEGEGDIIETESVVISLSGQDISRVFINWDYIDNLIAKSLLPMESPEGLTRAMVRSEHERNVALTTIWEALHSYRESLFHQRRIVTMRSGMRSAFQWQ